MIYATRKKLRDKLKPMRVPFQNTSTRPVITIMNSASPPSLCLSVTPTFVPLDTSSTVSGAVANREHLRSYSTSRFVVNRRYYWQKGGEAWLTGMKKQMEWAQGERSCRIPDKWITFSSRTNFNLWIATHSPLKCCVWVQTFFLELCGDITYIVPEPNLSLDP